MNYYKATIQYIGTNYSGFQWQKDNQTIQDTLNQVFYKILKSKVTTMGAARTDAGVHAFKQIVKISTESEVDLTNLLYQLNQNLPSDIKCLGVEGCDWSFRPANDCTSKEYHYYFSNIPKKESSSELFFANNPYELDIELMRRCAQLLIGKHSFHNFYTTGSNVKTVIREIYECDLVITEQLDIFKDSIFIMPNTCYQFRIRGNGFLKQMVRHLISALWLVGRKRISVEEFQDLLNGPKSERALWRVAPACGLYLISIDYRD